ncbi:MAG TPA: helix-turn-helix domain-containing protein, partial [Polaromonas sp.]
MSVLTFFKRFQPMNDFTILVLSGAYSSSVALTLDILSAAASVAARTGLASPRWRVYATDTRARLSHGLSIETKALPKTARADGSTWVVPGLGLDNALVLSDRLTQPDAQQAIQALRTQVRAGGTVAASCSAVFLLQAADLLAGKKVTTSWWLAPALQRLEPRCQVDADRMVITDGSVVTAGAALAQTDLMLHLLRSQFGPALADAVARVLLIDGRQAQAPFIVPSMLASGNELIAKLTARIEAALPNLPSVAELATEFCVSERTLARHVQAATGRSTLALVQSIRLGKARMLLETSRLTVDQVAERVGYGDATALRRLMRKVVGATPRQFRPSAVAQRRESSD